MTDLWTYLTNSAPQYELPKRHHVPHYDIPGMPLGYQAIDMIRAIVPDFYSYCLGNIIKYTVRAGRKGVSAADFNKAIDYAIWARHQASTEEEGRLMLLVESLIWPQLREAETEEALMEALPSAPETAPILGANPTPPSATSATFTLTYHYPTVPTGEEINRCTAHANALAEHGFPGGGQYAVATPTVNPDGSWRIDYTFNNLHL